MTQQRTAEQRTSDAILEAAALAAPIPDSDSDDWSDDGAGVTDGNWRPPV